MPLTGLILLHFCACPKPGSGFLMSYAIVFFVYNDLRLELIVCFVDICGIVNDHCLNFLFIICINLYATAQQVSN